MMTKGYATGIAQTINEPFPRLCNRLEVEQHPQYHRLQVETKLIENYE